MTDESCFRLAGVSSSIIVVWMLADIRKQWHPLLCFRPVASRSTPPEMLVSRALRHILI
jgi:hypothetical protein